jgi:hypothetical protein
MNDKLAATHASQIIQALGPPGRTIGLPKTAYPGAHDDHAVVLNANVCFEQGKVWWGDIDLTTDEAQLAELAAQTGQTVYVLWEEDGRFEHEDAPILEDAAYSTTPSGHSRFDSATLERRRDGKLGARTAWNRPGLRAPNTPGRWRFWKVEHATHGWETDRASGRTSELILGGPRRPGCARLTLSYHRFAAAAHGGWLGWRWDTAAQRQYAPRIRRGHKWWRGHYGPWIEIDLIPGAAYRLRLGVVIGELDLNWG